MRYFSIFSIIALLCCGPSEEAIKIHAKVHTAPIGAQTFSTKLGYEIEVVEARAVVHGIHFLVPERVAASTRLKHTLLPRAWAHPGHHHGGEITGELTGRHVIDWIPGGKELGEAVFLPGNYASAAYTFARGRASDGLEKGDPLLGRTAILRGVARKGGAVQPFTVLIDTPPDDSVDGIPFPAEITEGDIARIELRLLPRSQDEASLFDDIDFLALGGGENEPLILSARDEMAEGYEAVRQAFFDHRFHEVRVSP